MEKSKETKETRRTRNSKRNELNLAQTMSEALNRIEIEKINEFLNQDFKYDSEIVDYTTQDREVEDGNYWGRKMVIDQVSISSFDMQAFTDKLVKELKELSVQDKSLIERLLNSSGLTAEDWQAEVTGGYYGDSIHSVQLREKPKDKLMKQIEKLLKAKSLEEKVKLVLVAEYGTIPEDIATIQHWELRKVLMGQIKTYGGGLLPRIKPESISRYAKYELARGVVLDKGDGTYSLLDGTQRIAANKEEEALVFVGRR